MKGFFSAGILVCASILLLHTGAAAADEAFDSGRLEKEVLVTGLHDAVQLQVAPNGDVYYIERAGAIKRYSPATKITQSLVTVPIAAIGEGHMTGIALDPAFASNGWVYLYFSPLHPGTVMRLSRFTVTADNIGLDTEKILIEQPFMPHGHFGGGLQFDGHGDLWLSLGDNANANVTPETDERPGRENFNALLTSANSQDLRGKIIRIRPQSDGSYTIPQGNLFTDPARGRPEIFIMGCRNPYRFYFDTPSGALYWAEVGSNTEERFGTGGYDEITRSTVPGNSGWPLFIGPNTAYTRYDHATDTVGEKYSVDRPVNESRLNTGLRDLPKPIPAWIWYGSEDSKEFPELGNGGRSSMVGFVYRFNPKLDSAVKLPANFDGRLFIYEWCRNWIKTVTVSSDGGVAGIEPFFDQALLRRPIDLKLGPDGAIYMIEYGEKWGGNTDGVLSRIIYRRGNRAPSAVARVDVTAGAAPLQVKFSAASSSDPDGDELRYEWSFGEESARSTARDVSYTYAHRGVMRPSLTVTDLQGLTSTAMLSIAVGNTPPTVRINQPAHGGFFAWGESVPFDVSVRDAEDDRQGGDLRPSSRIQLKGMYLAQPSAGESPVLPSDGGGALMRASDCLSCHAVKAVSIGPSFIQVAARYDGQTGATKRLAEKIITGGGGAWGEVPMAPHPQLSMDDATAMAEAILSLGRAGGVQRATGSQGTFVAPTQSSSKVAGGVFVVTATYTDEGAPGLPALTTETRAVLHARRRRASSFDSSQGATVMEVATLIRKRRICVQIAAGGYLLFRDVNLDTVDRVECEVAASEGHGGTLELRVDSASGPVVGRVKVPVTGQWDNWETVSAKVNAPGGVRDLYVVHATEPSGEKKRFNLDVLEFVEKRRTTNVSRD